MNTSLALLMLLAATEPPPEEELQAPALARTHTLRFDVRADLPAGLAMGAAGISLVAFRPYLATKECRFSCTPGEINGLDASARALRWSDPTAARTLGDAVGYGALPAFIVTAGLIGLAEGQRFSEVLEDAWIIEEALALSHTLEGVIKLSVGRARPDTTFMPAGTMVADPSDLYTSMVSGHATAGFAVAVSTGVVAMLRGRPSAPWLLASGLTVAIFSSYLRIAADRHYLTDVLAGAALGTVTGIAVPLLFHGRKLPVTLAPQISPQGAALLVSGAL
jgi:membrane-associated phospholipid phosphatase